MMKKLFSLIIFLSFSSTLLATDRVVGLQGLIDLDGNQNYEWAGYSIVVEKNIPITDTDIAKIVKKYNVGGNIKKEYQSDNQMFIAIDSIGGTPCPELIRQHIFHFINKSDKDSDLLYFHKLGQRDLLIENKIVELYTTNQLSKYLVSLEVESIDFVGRIISLENDCRWLSPNNINCMGGQLSWSIFDSYQKAEVDNELQILKNNQNAENVVLDEDIVPIIFEGEQVFAKRIVYQSDRSSQNYPLIVYYVATEVEGQYVSCVMSHHGYNKDDCNLPDLLRKVMHFEEATETDKTWNEYSMDEGLTANEEEDADDEIYNSKYNFVWFLVKAGQYMPLGTQKDFFEDGTYVGLELNMQTKESANSISGFLLDVGLIIPRKAQTFYYHDGAEMYLTQTTSIVNVFVGYNYTRKLNRNLFLATYAKIGASALLTDLEKEYYYDDESPYESIGAFSLAVGTRLRFQRFFAFGEYNLSSYTANKRLSEGGNSAFMVGLGVAF